MNIFKSIFLKYNINNYNFFSWISSDKSIQKIEEIKTIDIKLLIGIEKQKKLIIENTYNFAKGNITNNALLWGTRGSGKSSLIKSVFNIINSEFSNLKILQLDKNDIFDIGNIYEILRKIKKFNFIVFIDDLSFDNITEDYKKIKSLLDGNLQNQPKNIILYVTSNRRHLISRNMIDNEKSSAIHTDENVEEKISLSDRFGLWIGFHNISQNEYIEMIKSYCKFFTIEISEQIISDSLKWSIQRGNRNGRTAFQFIINLAAEKNLRINF